MEIIHLKPRSIGRQFNIEENVKEMRAKGIDVIVVSSKDKPKNQKGRAFTSGELLSRLMLINNGQIE